MRQFLSILCISLLVALTYAEQSKPNVIFVLADDMGIGDLAPCNPECKIKTPHLQKMADEGISFADAHSSSSVCTPTRYGVLTGRYNWRSRLVRSVLSGTDKHLIPADRATVAHYLNQQGYHTQMIGKWHLGWDWAVAPESEGKWRDIDFSLPVLNGPNINGFVNYYGHCGSLDMPPYTWVDTGKITAIPKRHEGVERQDDPYGWYREGPISPDFSIEQVLPHLFDKSITYIKERAEDAKNDKPFFLYLPLPAPHTPIVPVEPYKNASGINPYADFVMQIDQHMGDLFAVLKEAGLDENTIVFFTSDNGCSPQANYSVLAEHGHDPSSIYRGHKAGLYEGAHRVPFLVRWPKGINAGQTSNALVCLTDFYATMQDIIGTNAKATEAEDSFSLVPAFHGKQSTARKTLVSHSISGQFAIRRGVWKLLFAHGSGGWSVPVERAAKKSGLPALQLYNLYDDPGEKNNLVESHKEKVEQLTELLTTEVNNGRCTPGEPVKNDRDVSFTDY